MDLNKVLKEMSLELGTKDGKPGYRGFVNGKMLDKTPPEAANLGGKLITYLQQKGWFKSFSKFDVDKFDVEPMADGSVILNPEEGMTITLSKEKVKEIMK